MKRNLFTLGLCLAFVLSAGAQTRKNWNFTQGWSLETVGNIEQAIVNNTGWLYGDSKPDGRYVTDKRTADTPMTVKVNGEEWEVPETSGLVFGQKSAKHLGVCVNYDSPDVYGKSSLWLNGAKDEDYVVVPRVNPGEKIFVVYEPARKGEQRGIKASPYGVIEDGTDPSENINTVMSDALDTAVFVVPETFFAEETDVKLKTTGGLFVYRICVGNELYEDTTEPEQTKIAYVFNSSYSGYNSDMDVVRSMFLGTDDFIRNKTVVDLDISKDVSVVDKDSLLGFDVVIVSSAVNGDEDFIPVLKSAIAYVPMLNLSSKLYPVWGYGTPVTTEDRSVVVGEAARSWSLFTQRMSSDVSIVGDDGTVSWFTDGASVLGYSVPDGTYFSGDSVIAVTPTDSIGAIHIHNMTRNAYMLLPYSYENVMYGDESMGSIIPNAIELLKNTKRIIPQTATPEIRQVYKKLQTEISFVCDTEGAQFYYTVDGSDPVTNGILYTEPFVVDVANTVVNVVALGDGFSYSEVVGSGPVVVKDQVSTPVVSVSREQGKSVVSVSCATDEVEIYYNFSGSNRPEASMLYLEPVEITQHVDFTAFAVHYELVTSETATEHVAVTGEHVRIDTLAHMDAVSTDIYGNGDLVKAYNYWTSTQATDEDGNPVYDEDGSVVYLPCDSMTYRDFTNGWAVGSYGQRINRQTMAVNDEIGTSTYGPLTIYDFGASDRAMSFLTTKSANDPASAWLQTTVKLQAPFDVVVYMTGQGTYGTQNSIELSVSNDSVKWNVIDTLETIEFKNIVKLTRSYEGDDAVYLKLRSVNDIEPINQRTLIFDVLVLNHGEKSKDYEDIVNGIETIKPSGDILRTEIYNINGTRQNIMQRGINIVKEVYTNGMVKAKKVIVK